MSTHRFCLLWVAIDSLLHFVIVSPALLPYKFRVVLPCLRETRLSHCFRLGLRPELRFQYQSQTGEERRLGGKDSEPAFASLSPDSRVRLSRSLELGRPKRPVSFPQKHSSREFGIICSMGEEKTWMAGVRPAPDLRERNWVLCN